MHCIACVAASQSCETSQRSEISTLCLSAFYVDALQATTCRSGYVIKSPQRLTHGIIIISAHLPQSDCQLQPGLASCPHPRCGAPAQPMQRHRTWCRANTSAHTHPPQPPHADHGSPRRVQPIYCTSYRNSDRNCIFNFARQLTDTVAISMLFLSLYLLCWSAHIRPCIARWR